LLLIRQLDIEIRVFNPFFMCRDIEFKFALLGGFFPNIIPAPARAAPCRVTVNISMEHKRKRAPWATSPRKTAYDPEVIGRDTVITCTFPLWRARAALACRKALASSADNPVKSQSDIFRCSLRF
jgi:hypothetical protein